MENKLHLVSEALGKAHAKLMSDLGDLDNLVRSARAGKAGELVQRLSVLKDHICEHFRFEEKNGYMDGVLQRAPQRKKTVDQLLQEHQQLVQALNALHDEVQSKSTVGEGDFFKLREWIEAVRQHEARENRLVEEVLNLDIAPED